MLQNKHPKILFEVIELPVSHAALVLSRQLKAHYALRSLDACHLAASIQNGIPVFWTCDSHFERLSEIAFEVIRKEA
jgi:predicted nucleic acid-binding protein